MTRKLFSRIFLCTFIAFQANAMEAYEIDVSSSNSDFLANNLNASEVSFYKDDNEVFQFHAIDMDDSIEINDMVFASESREVLTWTGFHQGIPFSGEFHIYDYSRDQVEVHIFGEEANPVDPDEPLEVDFSMLFDKGEINEFSMAGISPILTPWDTPFGPNTPNDDPTTPRNPQPKAGPVSGGDLSDQASGGFNPGSLYLDPVSIGSSDTFSSFRTCKCSRKTGNNCTNTECDTAVTCLQGNPNGICKWFLGIDVI